MGDVVDLGTVYWSEPYPEEMNNNLMEEIKFRLEENERLKKQLALSKKKLAARETGNKITLLNPTTSPGLKIIPVNNSAKNEDPVSINSAINLDTNSQAVIANKSNIKPQKRKKQTIEAMENFSAGKYFWKVPVNLEEARKKLNKKAILILDQLLKEFGRFEKYYVFFTISELAKKFNTKNRTRIREALTELKASGIILIYDLENQGKIIFFNDEQGRSLLEEIKSGKIKVERKNITRLDGKKSKLKLETKWSRDRLQNGSPPGYKTVHQEEIESIENTQYESFPKINHSEIIIKDNQQIYQTVNFEQNKQKYQFLIAKLKPRKMYKESIDKLIQKYNLDDVYQCFLDLEEKEKTGIPIKNLPGLLIKILSEYEKTEKSTEEVIPKEKELKYLKVLQCLEPEKKEIMNWSQELTQFVEEILSAFNLQQKTEEEKINRHFQEIGINSEVKKKKLYSEIKIWIREEEKKFLLISEKLKKILTKKEIKKLFYEAFAKIPDEKTKKLIDEFLSFLPEEKSKLKAGEIK